MVKKLLHIIVITFLGNVLVGQGLQTFDELLRHNFTKSDSLQIQILEAKKEYLLKDKGLRVNSSAGTNEFGDLDQGNSFRVKAGFEWNILDEGFMDRKVNSKLLDVEKAIQEFELTEEALGNNYAFIYNHIIYSFNQEKLRFIEEKSYLLSILSKRYEALYHNHAAEYQDLLAIYDKTDELKILRLAIDNYNQHFRNTSPTIGPELKPNYLPVVNIDIEGLLSHQIPDTTFEKIQELKLEKNQLKGRLDKQKRLAVYHNVYWRPLQDLESNRSLYNGFGVRFSTGLTSRKKEREKLAELENQVDIHKNQEKNFNQQKELSNYLLEYHSKLRIYSRFRYKLRKLQENKRVDRVVRMVNYKDPQTDLKELNISLEELSVEYELLELKQQLYLLLFKIYSKANVASILPFISERSFQDARKKLKGERIAVLESAYETNLDMTFLVEYLKKNELFHVIFKGNISQNRDFVRLLGNAGIDVYTGKEAFLHKDIVEVPIDRFSSRVEMEYWINDHQKEHQNTFYEINNINQLIHIDSVVLED